MWTARRVAICMAQRVGVPSGALRHFSSQVRTSSAAAVAFQINAHSALDSYVKKGKDSHKVKGLCDLESARKSEHCKSVPAPFLFLAGPSGSGKTQTDVAFALRHRTLMFMALEDAGRQKIINEMMGWSSQLLDLALVDVQRFDAMEANAKRPLPVRYSSSYLAVRSSFPSLVLGLVSRLMETFQEGFPINCRTQTLQTKPSSVKWRVKPLSLDDFWRKHKASVGDWTVILDESPHLSEHLLDLRHPSSSGSGSGNQRHDHLPPHACVVLFVRNLLRAAGVVPVLSGTNTSLSGVPDTAAGSGSDGTLRPFACIVRQGIGRPPHIVDGWVAELRESLRALAPQFASASSSASASLAAAGAGGSRSAEWSPLVAFLHQAFASSNPRLVVQMLEFLKREQANCKRQSCQDAAAGGSASPLSALASSSAFTYTCSPRSLLEAWCNDDSVRTFVDVKFSSDPLSSLQGQVAWLSCKSSTKAVPGTRFVDSHYALLRPDCAGWLFLSSSGGDRAVYDTALKQAADGTPLTFDAAAESRFPLPTEDPLLYLLALSNRKGKEALRMRMPMASGGGDAFDEELEAGSQLGGSNFNGGGGGGDFTVRSAFRKFKLRTRQLRIHQLRMPLAIGRPSTTHAGTERGVLQQDVLQLDMRELVSAGVALATRAGGLDGVPRVAFLRAFCTELLFDAHAPPPRFEFVVASAAAPAHIHAHAHAHASSAPAPASRDNTADGGAALGGVNLNVGDGGGGGAADLDDDADDRALDALLASLPGFPARFPVVTGPGLGPWPDAMHDVPELFLGELVVRPSGSGSGSAALDLPAAGGSGGGGGRGGGRRHATCKHSAAAASLGLGNWDGALIGPATTGKNGSALSPDASSAAPPPPPPPPANERAQMSGRNPPHDEDDEEERRAQTAFEKNKLQVRARGRLNYEQPLALIRCCEAHNDGNGSGNAAASVLADACKRLVRGHSAAAGGGACPLLFFVARSFAETDLAAAHREFEGLNVHVLHLRARAAFQQQSTADLLADRAATVQAALLRMRTPSCRTHVAPAAGSCTVVLVELGKDT